MSFVGYLHKKCITLQTIVGMYVCMYAAISMYFQMVYAFHALLNL